MRYGSNTRGGSYGGRSKRSSFKGSNRKTSPKPGDYARVVTSDDSLIRVGSFGVIEGKGRYSGDKKDIDVVFNFYTPFRHKGFINASGGPVRQVRKDKFIATDETKIVPEHDLTKDSLGPDMPTRERKVKVFDVKLP